MADNYNYSLGPAFFAPTFDALIKAHIERQSQTMRRILVTNGKQECAWWATWLLQVFPELNVAVVSGMYDAAGGSRSHTWVDVNGHIFDPTAQQFAPYEMRVEEYRELERTPYP